MTVLPMESAIEVSDLFNHYCFVISMVKKKRNINYYDSFWIWTLGFVCNVIKYLMLISMMKSIHYKNICYLEIYFKGVCQCRKLFIGEDCSHAISTPPTNLTLPGLYLDTDCVKQANVHVLKQTFLVIFGLKLYTRNWRGLR